MNQAQADALMVAICEEIVSWRDGVQFHVHYDDDGDGYRDFSNLELTPDGAKAIGRVVDKFVKERRVEDGQERHHEDPQGQG